MPEAPDAWSGLVELRLLSTPDRADTPTLPPPALPRRRGWRKLLLLVLLPTAITATYLYGFAADRYESEARFVLRKPNALAPAAAPTLGVEEASKSFGDDDAYALRDFLGSRDALDRVLRDADFRAMLRLAGQDPLWSVPGPLYGGSNEDLYRMFRRLVSIDYESDTGMTTVRAQAFSPEAARRIAASLLDAGEQMVNRLNDRVRADALHVAEADVARSRADAAAALDRLTAFREQAGMIDPTELSKTVLATIAALSLQAAEVAAQIDITREAAPNSPQLAPLLARQHALQAQIDSERATLAGGSATLAPKVAEFERLALLRDFAEKQYVSALTVLEMARLDAARQQAFLERVVEPQTPDLRVAPHRGLTTAAVFCAGLLLLWLFRRDPEPVSG